jgi:hypothetical protein
VGGRRKKLQRREKGWKEKREKVTVAALPLVRSWVDGNDGGKAGCGGGGLWQRKQKKKKKQGGCREERETDGGSWWLCRLPMVELVFVVVCRAGVLVLSPEKAAVEEVERERKKNREKVAETGKKMIFWLILDLNFSSLRP